MTEKLKDLDLDKIFGGFSLNDEIIDLIVELFKEMNVEITKEEIVNLIKKGGSTLRDFAKMKTNNDPRCNLIPIF